LKREPAPARTDRSGHAFNALSATGTLEHGVLHNEDLQVATDYLKARGKGTLDLNTPGDSIITSWRRLTGCRPRLRRGQEGAGELADLKAAGVPLE